MVNGRRLAKRHPVGAFLSTLVLATGITGRLPADDPDNAESVGQPRAVDVENPFPNRPQVPDEILDGGTEWLNTSGPIGMRDLRGKIVIFDFWTYCCINCMHVLPDLKYLEREYADELVVIGVHSAKFENERDSENIRQAIMRYEIEHPVINDSKMIIWRNFGARAWPTLALVDPEGKYCGSVSGEGHRELFDGLLKRLVKYHSAKGTLDRTPIRFDLERLSSKPTPLKYPGKVLADEANNRLFIADSNHNRIVIATLDGKLVEVIGNGKIGATNGAYDAAEFHHPQGMALVDEMLYVADTENHLIRTIDLQKKQVATLSGTGKQAHHRVQGGRLKQTALNSPWALLPVDGVLYVAMAGPHQIWSHRLGTNQIGVYAGTGREDITNGTLNSCALAQPSGMATDGSFLYVVDSEGSAVRKIPLDRRGTVTTVVGASDLPQGQALFEFGDIDGVGDKARLQHPLGIAWREGTLYVADSYNHKIKRIDVAKREATTWIGDGQPGDRLDPPRLSEPGGVSLAGGKLLIADTNNHRIAVADLETGKLSVLQIEGLEPPKPAVDEPDEFAGADAAAEVAAQKVAPGKSISFQVAVELPNGFKLNTRGPVSYRLRANEGQSLIAAQTIAERRRAQIKDNAIEFDIPLAQTTGSATLEVALSFTYCRDGEGGLCKLHTAVWRVPIATDEEAGGSPVKLGVNVD